MGAQEIVKTALKIAAWIAAYVIVPVLAALGLSAVFKWEFKTILICFAAFYIICFLISLFIDSLKEFIKKQVYDILKAEKIVKEKKGKKK